MLHEVVVEHEYVADLPLDKDASVVDRVDELLKVVRRDGSALSVVVGREVVVFAVGSEMRGFEGVPLRKE